MMNKIAYLFLLLFLPLIVFARDPAQVHRFRHLHPCPGGPDRGSVTRCHGYVVDHIKSLDCGGPDRPSNMQWQTIAAGKAKDKWERNGPTCKHRTHGRMPSK